MILIDEYDNFFNSVIGNNKFASEPEVLKEMEFTFKGFFSSIKSRLGPKLRVFIAGVTPMELSIYTSGFNVGYNNLQNASCSNLFGFTESDVDAGLKLLSLDPDSHRAVLAILKEFHNGYRFHKTSPDTLFNPTRIQFVLSTVAEFMQLNPTSSLAELRIATNDAEDPHSKPSEAVLNVVSSYFEHRHRLHQQSEWLSVLHGEDGLPASPFEWMQKVRIPFSLGCFSMEH
jgi:hypothetical protein